MKNNYLLILIWPMRTLEAGMKNKGTCKMPEQKKQTNKQTNRKTMQNAKHSVFSGPKASFTVKLDLVFKLPKG